MPVSFLNQISQPDRHKPWIANRAVAAMHAVIKDPREVVAMGDPEDQSPLGCEIDDASVDHGSALADS